MKHEDFWAAIDSLALRSGLPLSRLAAKAGLDPSIFVKSKRHTVAGAARWPNVQSITKILTATGTSFVAFAELVAELSFRRQFSETAARYGLVFDPFSAAVEVTAAVQRVPLAGSQFGDRALGRHEAATPDDASS